MATLPLAIPRNRKPRFFVSERCVLMAIVAVTIQAIATTMFIADALMDVFPFAQWLHALYHEFEALNAFALLAGVVLGALVVQSLVVETYRREAMVSLARGSLADLVHQRFREWGLTAAESEVALFSLKGLGINEIAELRESAPGTVRAQLSHIYMKAGVASQSGLMSLVVDDFLDVAPGDKTSA